MYFKLFAAALFASAAFTAFASPQPLPTPAPVVRELEARQDPIDDFTSFAASVITDDGASVFSDATSVIGSVGSEITSAAGNIITSVTSVGGKAFTYVSSAGGEALTLAESGAGVATTAFGSVYSVVASDFASVTSDAGDATSTNAAAGTRLTGLSSPVMVGLVTIMGSALLGAAVTL
ncbi:hypothetical protein Agabi119p4_841 [Agaricus bisporus var. burnettii]|uniref:Uncharacterized protein n=1 Tax=Agaricus bisporus var. burnettii TaxID=192524 RepID=A0A8H7KLC7_AGABI|nr:hypothetical protein Agabi119p4_841 [Agaricus bisporus var. burnettii]